MPHSTQTSSSSSERPSTFVIRLTATTCLGGCLFGYDLGAIGGALPQLASQFNLSENQQEGLVSMLYVGATIGASVGGTLCDTWGRQRMILMTDIVFMGGALWLYYCANSFATLLIGRFIVGMAVAISGVADVSYLQEVAPVQWRGAIVSVNEACISLGFLLAYIAGFVHTQNEEWRLIFLWAGIVALIQFVAMFHMPESPAWLAQQGRLEESHQAWNRIQNNNNANEPREMLSEEQGDDAFTTTPSYYYQATTTTDAESYHQQGVAKAPEHPSTTRQDDAQSWVIRFRDSLHSLMVLFWGRYRRQTYVALFLAILQQLCGQTIVLNYAPYIFAQVSSGTGGNAYIWSTLCIGSVKFVVTTLVVFRIEYWGRRTLLLAGMTCIAVGMLTLVVAFLGSDAGQGAAMAEEVHDDDEFDYSDLLSTNPYSFLALPGVLLVVCGYSMSFGPLTWLLTAELFPTEIRGRALGASTIVTYLMAALVTQTFLTTSTLLGGPQQVFCCMVS